MDVIHKLEKYFDVIECTGVIHHLSDPIMGWKKLVDVLAPDGVMKMGLYSRIARTDVRVAQSEMSSFKKPISIEEFRTVRNKIRNYPRGHPARELTYYTDFYSKSGLKDLLFHERECDFNLVEIQEIMSDLSLEMIGMEMPNGNAGNKYLQMFPNDPNQANIESLSAFEARYPNLFVNMYVFWCKKLSDDVTRSLS